MSKKLCFVISFVLVCALASPISQAQENQIINGEFDDGTNWWHYYGGASTS